MIILSLKIMCMKERKYDFFGISEAFNHALEWRSRGADSMIRRDVSPALRATDYKCPKYVWYKSNETNINEDKKTKVAMTLNDGKWAKKHEQDRRVYDIDALAPTMQCNGGGNTEPKIQEPINAMPDGTATTLTTAHHYAGNIVNPKRGQKEMGVRENFRIRKLTPRECFRLMDVDDKDIDKIQAAGISDSQQYKLAGNSIVVNVLTEIFRKLFVDTQTDDGQMRTF